MASTYPSFCVPLSFIRVEILEFNLITLRMETEGKGSPTVNFAICLVYLMTTIHILLRIALRSSL